MSYRLEVKCREGWLSGPGYWEPAYRWVTWAEYDTRAEAERVGVAMRAGSPRDCLGWRVEP